MTERDKMYAAFLAGGLRCRGSTGHAERLFSQWYHMFQKGTKPTDKKPEVRTFCNNPKVIKSTR